MEIIYFGNKKFKNYGTSTRPLIRFSDLNPRICDNLRICHLQNVSDNAKTQLEINEDLDWFVTPEGAEELLLECNSDRCLYFLDQYLS